MFKTLDIMRMAQDLARHSGARQAQIAKNIANADTPGYRAEDLASFSETYRSHTQAESVRTTRPGHQVSQGIDARYQTIALDGEAAPNGNTVSLELEMMRGTEAKSSHELALTVYRSSLDVIRTALGRGR